jgi:hypothetical protein
MRTGDKITGNSYYFNGDYIGQEVVWVRIYDVHGKLMSTPWQENSGYYPDIHHNSVPWLQSSEWKNWAWTATKSGIYTLKLGVSTCCDNEWATYAFHDDIKLALKDVNPHKPDNKK